ncbi:MAG: DUF4870 family protein [Erythrobacter sp.]
MSDTNQTEPVQDRTSAASSDAPVTTTPTSSPATSTGFDLNQPTIISLLYLGSYVTGFSGLVGIILAHVWQGDNKEAWATSHFTYAIRTFWFGFIGFVVAGILTVFLIGLLLFPLVAVWVGVRSVMSLLKAQKKEPMPDPNTLLF